MRVSDKPRALAITGCALIGLAVVLAPWFALDEYEPNGWDASWWPRAAAILALIAIVALRMRRDRVAVVLIAAALACIAVRAIAPPDFGVGFDGLDVPTERRWGLYVALGAAVVALAAAALRLRTRRAVLPDGRPAPTSQDSD
jgi:peptidoglycan/LPS O-acetylase OafA/YrhL